MKQELRRIVPLRTANIPALVYGLMVTTFMLIFSPFFLFAAFLAPPDEIGPAGPLFIFVMFVVYPIMGFVMGWIMGLLGAAIYSLVVRLTGGHLLDLEPVPSPSAAGPA